VNIMGHNPCEIVFLTNHVIHRLIQRYYWLNDADKVQDIQNFLISVLENGKWYARPRRKKDRYEYLVGFEGHYLVITKEKKGFIILTYSHNVPSSWYGIYSKVSPNTQTKKFSIDEESLSKIKPYWDVGK